MTSSLLPDELWMRVLEIGGLSYKDLCCLSITCRRLRRLSSDDNLWSHLLSTDFPPPPPHPNPSASSSSSKSLYELRFERDRDKRRAAHRRQVLRKESQIVEHSRKVRELETRLGEETRKLRDTMIEVSNFNRAREASAGLNVWQPEIVRGKMKQIVEQCGVGAESRLRALEMEIRVCRQQISGLEKAYRGEKSRLCLAEQELQAMKYHPLLPQAEQLVSRDALQCSSRTRRSKKLKRFRDSSEDHR